VKWNSAMPADAAVFALMIFAENFPDACFRRHDIIPGKTGIRNTTKNIEVPLLVMGQTG